jgi:hypothetical protein
MKDKTDKKKKKMAGRSRNQRKRVVAPQRGYQLFVTDGD